MLPPTTGDFCSLKIHDFYKGLNDEIGISPTISTLVISESSILRLTFMDYIKIKSICLYPASLCHIPIRCLRCIVVIQGRLHVYTASIEFPRV